jgi:hypothetical protein
MLLRGVYFNVHAIKIQLSIFTIGRHTKRIIGFFYSRAAPSVPGPPHYRDFTITLSTTALGDRQTSMLPAGFEPVIEACKGPQTHALGNAGTDY